MRYAEALKLQTRYFYASKIEYYMTRIKTLQLTIALAVLSAIGPILAAEYLAYQQGLRIETEHVLRYVNDVIHRSDRTTYQINESKGQIQAEFPGQACSEQMIARMSTIALEKEFVEVIGHMNGNLMDCSSLGWHSPPIDLGPPDQTTRVGNSLRADLHFPLAPNVPMVSLDQDGFVAIANRSLSIDLSDEEVGVRFATFTPTTGEIRSSNGTIDPEWLTRLGQEKQISFITDSFIVGVGRSEDILLTAAVAAVPLSTLHERVNEFTWLMVPIGLFSGLILAALVAFLARQHLSIGTEIKLALRRKEFYAVYQPIVRLHDKKIIGAEALLRWKRQDGTTTMPDVFIPEAEKLGLITKITHQLIELIEKDVRRHFNDYPNFKIAINISAADLESEQTRPLIKKLAEKINGECTVEITERVLLDAKHSADRIEVLRKDKISVALDDFGTGYSSLSYLQTLQFDYLKIDKIFVDAINTQAATNHVVLHIIEMAKTLGLAIQAEGVETEEQARFLAERNVEYAQGWLFGKPVQASDFSVVFVGAIANYKE